MSAFELLVFVIVGFGVLCIAGLIPEIIAIWLQHRESERIKKRWSEYK